MTKPSHRGGGGGGGGARAAARTHCAVGKLAEKARGSLEPEKALFVFRTGAIYFHAYP